MSTRKGPGQAPHGDRVQDEAADLYQRITAGGPDKPDRVEMVRSVPLGGEGCDGGMVHYFGPRDAPAAGRFDAAGHPPNCPAYTGPRCGHCGAPHGFGHYAGCDNPDRPDPMGLRRNAKPMHAPLAEEAAPDVGQIAHLIRHGADDEAHAHRAFRRLVAAFGSDAAVPGNEVAGAIAATRTAIRTPLPAGGVHPCQADLGTAHLAGPCACKSSEPAPPVEEESPAALARRLDREREEAAAAYRKATQAADAAWRAIGGRP